VQFGFRFSLLVSNKGKRIKADQLMTTLEIIASMSTDGKWLCWLKYQFMATKSTAPVDSVGGRANPKKVRSIENKISLKQFMNNFDFKEPFLAQRLFNYLDKDKSSNLSI